MNGRGAAVDSPRGFHTKKSASSSSRRAGATYFLCCRTKKPCNSKYSRTMVSLMADTLLDVRRIERFANQLIAHALAADHFADVFRQHEFDFATADFFVEAHGGE